MRLAYLIGGKMQAASDLEDGCSPIPEYSIFGRRNPLTFLDYSFMEAAHSPLVKLLRDQNKPHIAIAAAVVSKRKEYDAFLTSGEDIGLPLHFFMKWRRSKRPIFIITHGSYFNSSKFPLLLSILKPLHNVHFLCLSENLRKDMVERLKVPTSQVHNASYGVDTSFFRPADLSQSSNIVASAGAASRDYRTLVDAVKGLPLKLKIAADSAWFPSAVDISNDKLPENVEARSYGNYQGLKALYSSSAFVVVPLYPGRHACGYAVIVEAMAMGKAVIATRTQNHSDFIVDGETGYYVEPGDVAGLRTKIVEFLADEDKARQMGINGRRRVEQQFSNDAYCERIERIIASI